MINRNETDERLSAVCSLVRKGTKLADVGCDHGILITHLLEKGIITGGVALDINKLPLDKAIMRVKSLDMEDKIRCVLTDGLNGINKDEADDIVIAGIGGELIFKIISECPWKSEKGKRFIVQPMTKAPFLRIAMLKIGFSLIEEKACVANGKHYSVMAFEFDGNTKEIGEFDVFSYVGKLSQNLNKEAAEYIKGQAQMILKKAEGLKEKDKKLSEKYFKLAEEIMTEGGGR